MLVQVVGEHVHENDLVINVTKSKKLTNMRASDRMIKTYHSSGNLLTGRSFGIHQRDEYVKVTQRACVCVKSFWMKQNVKRAKQELIKNTE